MRFVIFHSVCALSHYSNVFMAKSDEQTLTKSSSIASWVSYTWYTVSCSVFWDWTWSTIEFSHNFGNSWQSVGFWQFIVFWRFCFANVCFCQSILLTSSFTEGVWNVLLLPTRWLYSRRGVVYSVAFVCLSVCSVCLHSKKNGLSYQHKSR